MKSHWQKFRSIAALAMIIVAGSMAAAPASAQTCEVKLGAIGPLSGGASAFGLSVVEGAKFAAASVNAQGGLPMGDKRCTVKVVEYDAKYTAGGGAAAAEYLDSQGVHITMGPVG